MDVVAHQRTAENDIDENRHTWWADMARGGYCGREQLEDRGDDS